MSPGKTGHHAHGRGRFAAAAARASRIESIVDGILRTSGVAPFAGVAYRAFARQIVHILSRTGDRLGATAEILLAFGPWLGRGCTFATLDAICYTLTGIHGVAPGPVPIVLGSPVLTLTWDQVHNEIAAGLDSLGGIKLIDAGTLTVRPFLAGRSVYSIKYAETPRAWYCLTEGPAFTWCRVDQVSGAVLTYNSATRWAYQVWSGSDRRVFASRDSGGNFYRTADTAMTVLSTTTSVNERELILDAANSCIFCARLTNMIDRWSLPGLTRTQYSMTGAYDRISLDTAGPELHVSAATTGHLGRMNRTTFVRTFAGGAGPNGMIRWDAARTSLWCAETTLNSVAVRVPPSYARTGLALGGYCNSIDLNRTTGRCYTTATGTNKAWRMEPALASTTVYTVPDAGSCVAYNATTGMLAVGTSTGLLYIFPE